MFQMNFKDKRKRRIAVVTASAAIVTAGGITAVNAIAAGETLAYGPTGTSATITNLDVTASSANALAAYGLKVTGASSGDTDPLRFEVLTGPSNAAAGVLAERISANGAPAANAAGTQLQTGAAALITFTSAVGKTLTLSGIPSADVTGHVLRFGTGGTAVYAYVASAGGTANPVLDHAFGTVPAGGVAVYDMGTSAFVNTAVAASSQVIGYSSSTNDNLYLGATYPGTYTVRFYKDRNDNGAYDSGQDDATPAFTLNVKDVNNTTSATTTDDLVPVITVPSSTGIGQKITAKVATGLTTTDTRGLDGGVSPAVGVLGEKIAAKSTLTFAGPGGIAGAGLGALGFDGSAVSRTSDTITDAASAATTTYGIGSAISVQSTTNVVNNNVSGVDLASSDVTGSVKVQPVDVKNAGTVRTASGTHAVATLNLNLAAGASLNGHRLRVSLAGEHTEYVTVASGAAGPALTLASPLVYDHSAGSRVEDMSAVAVKTGTAAVTYTATVTDGDTDKSGNTVYFTLGGTDIASLTTNGTTVDATNHVFSTTTDANGVASLTVTDGASTRVAYTVSASSNNVSGATLTSTYSDAAAGAVTITSSAAQLSPAVTSTSVTVAGKLTDQFGASFQPPSGLSQQVDVTNAATAHVVVTNGAFSYAYTPAIAPTAGSQSTLTFTYNVGSNPSANAVINWASATAANAVTITGPTTATTPNVPHYDGIGTGTTVTGAVTDSSNTGLAYKTVTLTGDAGVYFSTSATGTGMVSSLDVPTNSSGIYTAYAFYTKTGAAKITAMSEGKSASVTSTVNAAANTQAYNLTISNVATMPNSTTVVSGKVTDIFGNPVEANNLVTLTPDTVGLGVLGGSLLTTNANGEFSTTFVAGATSGMVTVTATINGGTNRTPDDTWNTIGGLTLPKGVSKATGTVTIAPDAVALAGPKSRLGAGNVTLTGTARPGASVDVYKKTASGLTLVDSTTADGTGKFSATAHVSANTVFLAKSPTATSPAIVVHVKSTIKVVTKVARGGVLRVSVSGGPSRHGTITVWITHGKKTTKVIAHVTGGGKTWVLKPGKGYTTIKATYASSGCDASSVVSTRVKL
jgi:hypothetical protein